MSEVGQVNITGSVEVRWTNAEGEEVTWLLENPVITANVVEQEQEPPPPPPPPEVSLVVFEPGTQEGDCYPYDMDEMAYPTKGVGYTDPIFDVDMERFTAHLADYVGDSEREPTIQYSTFGCSNCDNTMVMFKLTDREAVFYTVDGEYLRYKYFGAFNADMELRWSNLDPNLLFYRQKKEFRTYRFDTDETALIRDFTYDFEDAKAIANNDKGEQVWGWDKYWAFRGRTNADAALNANYASWVICYDYELDQVYKIDTHAYYADRGFTQYPAPRYVTMSPSGEYVIVNFVTGGSTGGGHTALFSRMEPNELVWVRDVLDYQTGHPGWGYDVDGNEVFYRFDSPDFYMYDLETGERFTLLDAIDDAPSCEPGDYYADEPDGSSRAPGYHISTSPAWPGWVFYSSYDGYDGLDSSHWLDRVVFAIKASRNVEEVKVVRLAHTRCASTSYSNQARTQISADGQHLYFDSNWLNTEEREIFRIEIPANLDG